MTLDQLRQFTPQLMRIAHKHGIVKVFVFGSVARGEAASGSDLDLLVEMQAGASLFGVAGFCYEAEQLLGVRVDVVPASLLPGVSDRNFSRNIQREAVAL